MNRNPIIPFVLIMVIGVVAMFLMSFKGLGDMEEIAAQKENGGAPTEETASATPEDIYQQKGCVGCHGGDYSGGVGPALKGTALSQEEIANIIVNGKNAMPGGLVTAEQAPAMAEWIATLK